MERFIKNRISVLLKEKAENGFRFVPDRDFYNKTGIKQKRWGQLLRNDKPASTEELYGIAKFFNFKYIDIMDLD
jgi:hypothetical protein